MQPTLALDTPLDPKWLKCPHREISRSVNATRPPFSQRLLKKAATFSPARAYRLATGAQTYWPPPSSSIRGVRRFRAQAALPACLSIGDGPLQGDQFIP